MIEYVWQSWAEQGGAKQYSKALLFIIAFPISTLCLFGPLLLKLARVNILARNETTTEEKKKKTTEPIM